jgi:hypothetical protein
MKKLCAFIKVGEQEHIHDLHYKGTIFMNGISRFKEIEDNYIRGDRYEGDFLVDQAKFLKLKIKDKWIEFTKQTPGFNGQLNIEYQNTQGNIFSLYLLFVPSESGKIDVDRRMLEFGDACLLIHNVDEFWRRVKSTLEREYIKIEFGYVQYYDYKTFMGHAGVFHKSSMFEYQNEFRVFIAREESKPLIIQIGDISDISKIFKSSDLLNLEIEF